MEELFTRFPRLNGLNYKTWQQHICLLLRSKGILKYVDGTAVHPGLGATTKAIDNHDAKDGTALNIIFNSIEKQLQSLIADCTTANQAWTELKRIYELPTFARLAVAMRTFFVITYKDKEPMAVWIKRVTKAVEDLADLGYKVDPQMVVMQLLATMPESMQPLVQQLYTLDTVHLTVDKISSTLLAEEMRVNQRNLGRRELVNQQEVTNQWKPRGRSSSKGPRRQAQRSGSRKRSKSNNRRRPFRGNCYGCGKQGHLKRDCRNKKTSDEASMNQTTKGKGSKTPIINYYLSAAGNEGVYATSGSEVWIIDSGATSHFCNDANLFTDMTEIALEAVMSTDARLPIKGIGTVRLEIPNGRTICLNKAYYTPDARINLISASRLDEGGFVQTIRNSRYAIKTTDGDTTLVAKRINNCYVVDFADHGQQFKSNPSLSAKRSRNQSIRQVNFNEPLKTAKKLKSSNGEALAKRHISSNSLIQTHPTINLEEPQPEVDPTNISKTSRCDSPNRKSNKKSNRSSNNRVPTDYWIWHRRLCHPSFQTLKQMVENGTVHGLPRKMLFDAKDCEDCRRNKMTRSSHPPMQVVSTRRPLELIHMDIWGPNPVESRDGHRYFISFIDDYTRHVHAVPLKQKSEAVEAFEKYMKRVERLHTTTIKAIRSDNGLEFCNFRMQQLTESLGIEHQHTNIYTPEQNGVAERFNRTLIEKVRLMLNSAQLPKSFWAEALVCAAYTVNRLTNKRWKFNTPTDLWTGRAPTVKHLRAFGTKAKVHVPKQQRDKLDPTAMDGIIVGYANKTVGYRVFIPQNNRVIESSNVYTNETEKADTSGLEDNETSAPGEEIDSEIDSHTFPSISFDPLSSSDEEDANKEANWTSSIQTTDENTNTSANISSSAIGELETTPKRIDRATGSELFKPEIDEIIDDGLNTTIRYKIRPSPRVQPTELGILDEFHRKSYKKIDLITGGVMWHYEYIPNDHPTERIKNLNDLELYNARHQTNFNPHQFIFVQVCPQPPQSSSSEEEQMDKSEIINISIENTSENVDKTSQ
ncbi:hypothetical protein CHUAL_013970 [Chamberlinius hualienensis]